MSQKFHITCTLPNASLKINGIDFVQVEKNVIMTAEAVGADIADHFREIAGYVVDELDAADQEAIEEAERLAAEARARVRGRAKAKATATPEPAPAPAPAPEPETPVIDAASAAAAAGDDTPAIQAAADAAVTADGADDKAAAPAAEGAEGPELF